MTKKINLKTKPAVRYFTLDENGRIYSCNTEAKNINEAIESAESIGMERVIEIDENNLDFIADQFGYRLEKLKEKSQNKELTIVVYNGVVDDVKNLPDGWVYKIKEIN